MGVASSAEAARVTSALRKAVATRLAGLLGPDSRQSVHEVETALVGVIGLDVVPGDGRPSRLALKGGDGLGPYGEVGFRSDDGSTLPHVDEMAARLTGLYPPRKRASAILTRDDEPAFAVALYESRELQTSFYVMWSEGDVRMYATADRLVEDLDVATDERPGLAASLTTLSSGEDLAIPIREAEILRP